MATNSEAAAPRLPTRPPHRHEQLKATLKEAFPDTDDAIIRAVLAASGFRIEPAFNALLGLNDPSVAEELEQLQSTPTAPQAPSKGSNLKQLEEDEMCARKLARRYRQYPASNRERRAMMSSKEAPRNENQRHSYDEDSDDYSFLEDDLPVLKDNFVRGFQSIKQRGMAWMDRVASKLDGSDDERENDYETPVFNNYSKKPIPTATELESAYEDIPPPMPARKNSRPDTAISLPPYEADPHMLNEKDFERLRLESTSSPLMGRSSLASTRKSVESSSSAAFTEGQSLILDSNGAIEVSNSAFALDDSDLESNYEEDTAEKDPNNISNKGKDADKQTKENARDLESVSEEQYGPATKTEHDAVKKDKKTDTVEDTNPDTKAEKIENGPKDSSISNEKPNEEENTTEKTQSSNEKDNSTS
ncbi:CUE domain-containing protein [Schizosaccharomyces cryophilus OY26]|uniref:CUE domain-containing protein n=1 Tax=Schizosaccharomyces cryophilus (strain OY26 / ATCC MYA-4695 / CBS 11777 / NBRC 106824 / NRRL Y48691) TaxID=653667 RepID=S9W8K8_SCHCR|nr:CUE domain-containing protein [Schizosaccharomyces cryophilus OY26]EPY54220.1 CUE domain-containing protein [Schizosaccharomyces cryophilus OY26]